MPLECPPLEFVAGTLLFALNEENRKIAGEKTGRASLFLWFNDGARLNLPAHHEQYQKLAAVFIASHSA
jgi:hypothetical protein